ncbi:MAG: fimbrillin family protein [Alistipes sp.]|nr:fimbrillin family protein [Alistipes sp.]
MKKILLIVPFVALLVLGCSSEDVNISAVEPTTTIEVVADIKDSRTYYDGSAIHWADSGEQLNILYYDDDNSLSISQTPTHTNYIIDSEGRIRFTADFTTTNGATRYTLGAFYPYAYQTNNSSMSIDIAQEQSPSADSYDPASDILVSKQPIVVEGIPESVKLSFARMVAFAKMTLKGIGEGEIIEKVIFSSSAKPAGCVEFSVLDPSPVESAKWHNSYEDITIIRDNWIATGEDVVWMTTIPTDLSNTDFSVTVVTDKHTYSKSVDLAGKSLNFKRAEIAKFSVTLQQVDIAGNWHLTEWRGAEPSFDVYMSIDNAYGVTLWQRIESREWQRYESSATFANGIISGLYSDGVAWSTSYSVAVDGETMTWTDTVDSTDISVYTRSVIPDSLPTTITEETRTALAERFL